LLLIFHLQHLHELSALVTPMNIQNAATKKSAKQQQAGGNCRT
jgi:hypothetical protein